MQNEHRPGGHPIGDLKMFYEEKVIDGSLWHRTSPDGEWTPFTASALTTALMAEKLRANTAEMEVERLKNRLYRIERELRALP